METMLRPWRILPCRRTRCGENGFGLPFWGDCCRIFPIALQASSKQAKRGTTLRALGRRTESPITFSASARLLAQGARFNDDIHRLPTGNRTFIPKGLYRFRNFEEANRHDLDCIAAGMAQDALERS